ncbi:MAG: hypothetical protein RLZZ360_489 [Candidatus Parcubacteria bacterium]|jgi:hypothetical protein
MKRELGILQSVFQSFVLTMILFSLVGLGQAQVMNSSNFGIERDSINFGGGYASSSSYQQESTFGEIATGNGSSTNFSLEGGYQQMGESYISLSVIGDVAMSPDIGLAGGVSNGTTFFIVTTDNRLGYRATLESALAPALQSGGNTIANYVPGTSNPDVTFSTNSTQAHFGFTPEGVDIAQRYRDNGSACGVGSGDTVDACWDMVSTTPIEIVRRTTSNHPSGATTTLKFRIGIGSGAAVTAGTYVATSTVTAITL